MSNPTKEPSSICRWAISLFLFLTAFLPRAIRPVSRPLVWYLRSAHFVEALLAGNWANTVYSEHPGVGLMWPVGIALKLYWILSGVTPAAHSVPPDFEPIHFFGPVPIAEIGAGVAALALLIALGIVAIYYLLRRLFDPPTATAAGFLLALSPYYLTQSKVLHLDAWMATVMLLSALTLLLYRRGKHTRWLLVSGALGGLALLIKTLGTYEDVTRAIDPDFDLISEMKPYVRRLIGRRLEPSRLAYEQSHPTVSFRLDREIRDRLKGYLSSTGCSFADFVKDALGREQSMVEKTTAQTRIRNALGILWRSLVVGLGFTLALMLLGAIREVLGSGTLLGYRLGGYRPASVMIMAPGAFIVLGLLLGYFQWRRERKEAPPVPRPTPVRTSKVDQTLPSEAAAEER